MHIRYLSAAIFDINYICNNPESLHLMSEAIK